MLCDPLFDDVGAAASMTSTRRPVSASISTVA
jgi:hypothetical protein